jgi:hypothetical protein
LAADFAHSDPSGGRLVQPPHVITPVPAHREEIENYLDQLRVQDVIAFLHDKFATVGFTSQIIGIEIHGGTRYNDEEDVWRVEQCLIDCEDGNQYEMSLAEDEKFRPEHPFDQLVFDVDRNHFGYPAYWEFLQSFADISVGLADVKWSKEAWATAPRLCFLSSTQSFTIPGSTSTVTYSLFP